MASIFILLHKYRSH